MNKSIKKFVLYTFTLGAATLFISATNATAATTIAATTTAGSTLTVSDPTGNSGASLTFNPSPNVLLQVASISNRYAINSMNTSVANGDRNEYAVWSGNTGYYQGVNADTTVNPITTSQFAVPLLTGTDITSDPFSSTSSLHSVGGSSSSGS
ncbi:hypothetical protein ACOHYD_12720 [Desulfobacterota bacterium M19]